MDKVKKFLEGYVEWLALGLAVLFLGWTVYGYVVQKPVTVAVGAGHPNAEPSEIPGIIWDEQGNKIATALAVKTSQGPFDPQIDPAVVLENIKKVSPGVTQELNTGWLPPPVLADQGANSLPAPVAGIIKIKALPIAPAPINPQISGGHSNVPGLQPAVAGGNQPQGNQVLAVDKNWRTVEATIPMTALAKAFKDAGISPGSPYTTCMLHVELIREQMNTDGSWGPDSEIPALDLNPASPIPPLPPVDADLAVQKDFVENFAEKNVVLICQPPFYQVLQGDVWYEPGTKNPNETVQAVEDIFDPKDPGAYTGDPNKLLPSERKAYDEAKAKQAARDALRNHTQGTRGNTNPGAPPSDIGNPGIPSNGTGTGNGNGGGGGRRGGRSNLASDPQRPGFDGGFPPPRIMGPGGPNFPGAPPQMQQGQPGQVGGVLPTGSFDPSQTSDIKIWAHDTTVVAGKTYRYKLRYYISNPVARTTGLCDPQSLAKIFDIQSADSVWTDAVNVQAESNFFAVELRHGVHFDVFKWKNGSWQMQSVQVNPGDMVGSVETDPTTGAVTDFSTGWTLVDIRDDPTNTDNHTLVLVSDNGTVLKKEMALDAHSSAYRELYNKANEGKTNANAGTPAAPPLQ